MIKTLARGSNARIDLIAEKDAVPPPIIRYGTFSGIPLGDFLTIFSSVSSS